MWRWRVCSVGLVLAGCTDSGLAPASTDFLITASVQDTRLLLTVDAYDLTAPVTASSIRDATVSATFRGQTHPVPATMYGPYLYATAIELTDAIMADEQIAVTVSHDDTTETVTNAMPADFTLVPPTDPKVGAPVDIAWSPSANDPMTWSGYCDADFDGPVPTDTGMLEFPAVVFDASPLYGCSAELAMTRTRTASPDTAFVIYFRAEQQHTIAFEITP